MAKKATEKVTSGCKPQIQVQPGDSQVTWFAMTPDSVPEENANIPFLLVEMHDTNSPRNRVMQNHRLDRNMQRLSFLS